MHVNELDGSSRYKKDYKGLKKLYTAGELETFLKKGSKMVDEIKYRLKGLPIERSKKIAGQIIKSRIMISRLRTRKTTAAQRKTDQSR